MGGVPMPEGRPYPTFLNFRNDRRFSGIGSFGNRCGHCVHDTSPT